MILNDGVGLVHMKEITIVLNARLQPMHRIEMFEEPLENALSQTGGR